MDIQIRKAQQEDAPALATLLRSIGWSRRMQNEPVETTTQFVRQQLDLCLSSESHTVYVAEEAEAGLIGYVAVHWLPYLFLAGPEGFISDLFVHETGRGQGVGSQLLKVVIEEARNRGCSRLQLINFRTRESYQRSFYSKVGWQERPDGANFVYYLE
jgi:GNAT superfamily N-acetyltransferase